MTFKGGKDMKIIKESAAIKTKRAPVLWDRANMITAYSYGDKDPWGKAIWYDEQGKAYELIYDNLYDRAVFVLRRQVNALKTRRSVRDLH